MKTNIHKTFQVEEPIEKVWDHLSDPNKIVTCVPGASLTEQIDNRNYKGAVTLKFGPVKASYNGKITFEELDENSRTMKLNGKGTDTKGKGSADMLMQGKLSEKEGGTKVDVNMEITITGKLAQFGARLISEVSNSVFDQFVENFREKLKAAPTATVPTVEVIKQVTTTPPVPESTPAKEENSLNVFSLLWRMIKNLFGGRG